MLIANQPYMQDLQSVITSSWFTVDEAVYVYASVSEVIFPEKHLLIVRDGTEITVATDVRHLPLPHCLHMNKEEWKLLNIRCSSPFYCVGFIATISDALARAGIDIVMVSSFSNDLILVMQKDLERTVEILVQLGFRKNQPVG